MSLFARITEAKWDSDNNKIATVEFFWDLTGKTDAEIEKQQRVLGARLDKFIVGRLGIKYKSDEL